MSDHDVVDRTIEQLGARRARVSDGFQLLDAKVSVAPGTRGCEDALGLAAGLDTPLVLRVTRTGVELKTLRTA